MYKSERIAIKYIKTVFKTDVSKETVQMPNCDFQTKCIVDASFTVNSRKIFVEVNGKQHYQPVMFGRDQKSAKINFTRQKKRDRWLRKYCKNNNIVLIEVDLRKYRGINIKRYLQKQFQANLLLS